jgi:hypothetical protein
MSDMEYLDIYLRIATVAVPVGVYFLILGLLNSRRNPQLLSGLQDFALLIAAISPLFVLPALQYVGMSVWTVAAAAAAVAGIILVLAPRGPSWVVYNLSQLQARRAIGRILQEIGSSFTESKVGFHLHDENCFVEIGGFPLLHNVSVRLRGGNEQTAIRFEEALSAAMASIKAEANPAGVSLLLVATGMLITPLALMAHEVPQIVRLLTDLF